MSSSEKANQQAGCQESQAISETLLCLALGNAEQRLEDYRSQVAYSNLLWKIKKLTRKPGKQKAVGPCYCSEKK